METSDSEMIINLIEEDDVIDDIGHIRTKESERRKTSITETGNLIALAVVSTYILLLLGQSLGILTSPSNQFEGIQSLIGVILGFYFGRKITE